LISPFKGTWRYEYDAFGRRITKYQVQTDQTATDPNNPYKNQLIDMPIRPNQDYWHKINELWERQEQQSESQTEKTPQKSTALSGWRYLYKQDQLVAEAPLQVANIEGNLALTPNAMQANWAEAIYWLYQEDNFTPTARYEKGRLHYTVADQVGTITELLTEEGYIDYRQKLNLWGEAEIDGHRHYAANDSSPLKCNHRFVGQYYDDESELHYNRFRYYSPETGQYISHDPIGLLGGFNPYGYVFNPCGWVDPLGLALMPVIFPPAKVIKQVTISMQGYRDGDFKAANAAAGINGARGKPTIGAHKSVYGDVTWHHMDYDPATNTATMQLVQRADHEASLPHKGSVKDFEDATGLKYESDEAKSKAQQLNQQQSKY
ncbi:HNH endonuclease, partial [Aggregatibacter actinomycetemcomitans]|nr:HNH endonuclease [Aggregatibacter actinomycetemcomitans]